MHHLLRIIGWVYVLWHLLGLWWWWNSNCLWPGFQTWPEFLYCNHRRSKAATVKGMCLTFLALLSLSVMWWLWNEFLANVNSRSRLLYAIARPSAVCLSSVTFVRPTQAVQIFGNISTASGTLIIRWHPLKISRRSSPGNPSAGGVKHKRGSQI